MIHLSIILAFIMLGTSQSINCTQVAQAQCGIGYCSNYQFVNNACVQQTVSCSSTQYFSNSTNLCSNCHSLTSSDCSSSCSVFSFFNNAQTTYTPSGSVNGCSSCEDAFGLGCTSCSVSACANCDSHSTLNTATGKCIGTACSSLANCYRCTSATTCDLCLQGFDLNLNTFVCEASASACKIKYCILCAASTTCSACFTGYKLSTGSNLC